MKYKENYDLENEAVISDIGRLGSQYSVSIEGKYQTTVTEWDDAIAYIKKWSKRNNYYPNIYYVDDHGGIEVINENKSKGKITMEPYNRKFNEKEEKKKDSKSDDKKAKSGIKAVIDTDWGGSNAEQYKNIQIMSGLAGSDSESANKFLKKINDFTSKLKAEDF